MTSNIFYPQCGVAAEKESKFFDLFINLGKFPVQTVTIQSTGPRDLIDRLEALIRPVNIPPNIERPR